MIPNKSSKTIPIIIGLIVVLCVLLVLSLSLLLNLKFPFGEIDYTQITIRAVPPLLGAAFSGFIALLVYYLNKMKDIDTKNKNSSMALRMIQIELIENQNVALDLKKAFERSDIETLTQLLSTDDELKEMFIVIHTKFTLEITDKLFGNLLDSDYLLVAKEIKNIRSIKNMLSLLNKDITSTNNKESLLKLINNILNDINTIDEDKPKNSNLISVNYIKNLVTMNLQIGQLILFLIIILLTFIIF